VTSIHTALDALADLMREHQLRADDIAEVDAGLSHMTHVHCAWEYKAQGVTAAQMNLSYGLAVIALDGMAFVDQYREDRCATRKYSTSSSACARTSIRESKRWARLSGTRRA